jgi:hypothetical protein
LSFHIFYKFSHRKYHFSWSKQIVWNQPSNLNAAFMGKAISTYIILNNVAGFGTTDNVTSRHDCTIMQPTRNDEEKPQEPVTRSKPGTS